MALAVAVSFGIYVFATADVVAAVLGRVAAVTFLTGGVPLAVVLAERRPAVVAQPSPRVYLGALTFTLALVGFVILLYQ